MQSTISRQAAEYMVLEMDLTKLVGQMEWDAYGVDEQLFPTLQATDAIELPGGFTHACLKEDISGRDHAREEHCRTITHFRLFDPVIGMGRR